MKKVLISIFTVMALMLTWTLVAYAQLDQLHGDFANLRDGLHSGNQLRLTVFNDGTFGQNNYPPDIGGEWPINSGAVYIKDGNVFVGSEVKDNSGQLIHMTSTVRSSQSGGAAASEWSTGDQGPNGEWYTFLPLPGLASEDTNKIAMNKWPWSWPAFWPDRSDDAADPGWANDDEDGDPAHAAWNGYFGKNIENAEEESYFIADDYQNKEWDFTPDANDPNRGGLGLRMSVRGMQWASTLVEDAIFCLFDIENIGTYSHQKMVFGYKIGNNVGELINNSGDYSDDSGKFDKDGDIAYLYDSDNQGVGGWSPVGWIGGVFLESPGNHIDGIDNDGDGANLEGPVISEDLFQPVTYNQGDDVVVIDYETYERSVVPLPAEGISIVTESRTITVTPGVPVEEIPFDLVDNNFNGIIDENNGATIGTPPNEITTYLYTSNGSGAKYIDYLTDLGKGNILLDERRDDNMDNDSDWNPETDDVGLDGVAGTNDPGEGDGIPTSGAGTNLPGEPHMDKTDISESDMIGLTSFVLYSWPTMPHYEDELVWTNLEPGRFDDQMQNANIELLFGSGYFPMVPGQVQRFSMGLVLGINEDDLLRNKEYVAQAYTENYNFLRAPSIPTVKVVAGDNRVTLFWDNAAELSRDPITGNDFEGYKIYRSTDPGWGDMDAITDAYGVETFLHPLAQFDLDNDFEGFHPVPLQGKGVQFYLGSNTGLVHSYVDTTVTNGFTYYYAVTSYDHGDQVAVAPTECTKAISIGTDGEIEEKGPNVVRVRPEAPAAGYVTADSVNGGWLPGRTTDGTVSFTVKSPSDVKDGHTYQVVFEDTTILYANRPRLYTQSFSLVDVTDSASPDTLINHSKNYNNDEDNPLTDGFMISLSNLDTLTEDQANIVKSNPNLLDIVFQPYRKSRTTGTGVANDYRVEFGELGYGQSTELGTSDAVETNVKVFSLITGDEIAYALEERDGRDGMFTAFTTSSRSDVLILLEPDANDSLIVTWSIELASPANTDSLATGSFSPGDFIEIPLKKPFLSQDVFQFTMKGEKVDTELAKDQMDDIRVVPNPYVVANSWEPSNPYSDGRGPRELHFIHLPPQCTIRIFTVRGQLVQTIEHDEPIWDGTEVWDMMTKDNLDIAYGIYVYHVEAKDIGSKIGKFAVIK